MSRHTTPAMNAGRFCKDNALALIRSAFSRLALDRAEEGGADGA